MVGLHPDRSIFPKWGGGGMGKGNSLKKSRTNVTYTKAEENLEKSLLYGNRIAPTSVSREKTFLAFFGKTK